MTDQRYYLGVDIGNTKSQALIANADGHIIALGQAGPGNHEVLGVDGFQSTMLQVVTAAFAEAQLDATALTGAGFGIAGYDWPSDDPMMVEVIQTLGFDAPFTFVNDAVIGLIAGTQAGWGVSVSAGTSANCYGRDMHGKQGRITGNGATFGEYGGGIELVNAAVQAISRAWSLRGEPTQLTERFVEHVGATSATDLLEGMARGKYTVRATDAPLVFEAAQSGDKVANDLINWISTELAGLAIGVARQLDLLDLEFEIVLAGNFYKGSEQIQDKMAKTIAPVAPQARLVRLDAPPVVGAVMLGMEQAGIDFVPLRQTLIKTTNDKLRQATRS